MNIRPAIFPKYQFQSKLILSTTALLISTLLTFLIVAFLFGFYQEKINKSDNDLHFTMSKSIGLANTIVGSTSTFNEEEISKLKEMEFCKELGFVTKAKFNCVAGFFENKKFSSEIILEAIPNSMMDGPTYRFYWEEGQKEVPIIISSDFLQLYNFVYAPIAGLPPVSIDNLSLVPIQITLLANGKRKKYNAEIIGLSDRFSGLFVPKTFLDWANIYFTGSSDTRNDKAVVLVDPSKVSDFESYIDSEGFIINNENLRMGKAASLVYPISAALLMLTGIFIILSVSNFWLQWKWLLERQKENIQLLYFHGYQAQKIAKTIFIHLLPYPSVSFFFSLILGLVFWFMFKTSIMNVLALDFLPLPIFAILIISAIYVLILLSLYFAVSRFCKKSYI